MPNIYGVWITPIDGDTGAESVERYGDVLDIGELMDSDDRGRDFCDGQTSPLPPRFADDSAGMIYTYDRATAEYWSGVVRSDLAARVSAGDVVAAPSWLSAAMLSGRTAAVAETVLAAETLPATIGDVRGAGNIAAAVTDSQIENQIRAYVEATGDAAPTIAVLVDWIRRNARWASADV